MSNRNRGVVLLAGLAWLATAPAASARAQAAAPAAAPPAATQQRQQPVVAMIATGGTRGGWPNSDRAISGGSA